jgi:2-keto-4-pentenoate hydratase/2-oxohepta-3-ene-1,7-dioic acid hydratase in catechol pathway
VKLLDYEIEIGLVFGKTLAVGTEINSSDIADYIAGLVITNDVSARDVQLPKTQFYEGKSYPTFTPVGPVLLLLEAGEFARFSDLGLTLRVNGEVRQDSTVADMIYRPLETLRTLVGFQRMDAGDLLLTGTPGGTALKAPAKPVEMIGALVPPAVKWKVFFKKQASNPLYLKDGDVVELSVSTPDGALDLGIQRTTVRYA